MMKMLQNCLQQFCDKSDNCREIFATYLKKKNLNEREEKEILEKLCLCLMNPDYTQYVAECFPQILLLLLSMVIMIESEKENDITTTDIQVHRLNCVVLGKLISDNPDVLGFALRYFERYPAPFEITSESEVPRKKSRFNRTPYFEIKHVSDYELVHACYDVLRAAPNHFKHIWNWSSFYDFLISESKELQWIALKCIGIVLNMSDATLEKCAHVLIPEYEKFLVSMRKNQNNVVLTTDNNDVEEVERAVKNSKSLVSIAGVLLPIFNNKKRSQSTILIPVPSMESNLRSLALAVASRKCICLQGPVGCGKTALVEYLAQITGRGASDFVKVQLGDQTDSKMLLGTYRCTDIPGEFVWQPGVLTQCVMLGKWLLLEDIDSAALDVASVLSNLMETGTLSVPGYRDTIYAKSGFQLFVTQRLVSSMSGLYRQSTGASNLLEKYWLCINMNPLTKNELVTIIQKLFPSLATIATKIVNVFLLFSTGNHDDDGDDSDVSIEDRFKMSTGRLISTRDLIKWCTRVIVDYDVVSRDSLLKLLQDAIDIFCCSVVDINKRLELAISIEHTLGIVDKAKYYVNEHKPSVVIHKEIFTAGRAKVQKKNIQFAQVDQTKVNFSFTRPSAALLERVTMCVAQKEPVLLVGETGTGKTSSIQFLARSTGHNLIVINMNQQSESADLLGGYKPVDMKFLITPIREEFEILFRSYYAIEPNKKFLEHIGTSYKHGKWKTLVTLMCHSVNAALKRLRMKTIEESKIGQKRKNDTISNGVESIKEHRRLLDKWEKIHVKLVKLKSQIKTEFSLAFSFIEGSLIKALKEGYWVLLDEINLASSETLECLSGLLEGSSGSLSLFERGDRESIKRHQDFTIFACMNPATDVGKKELPVGLRNRFTEFYVDELTDSTDLHLLIDSYLAKLNLPAAKHRAIVKFYLNVRKEATNSLNDGTGHKPHYSLRTLCRALSVAATNPCGNPIRSLYEAFCLSFLTQLDHRSYPTVQNMIAQGILDMKNVRAVLSAPIPKPKCASDEDYINFEGYWVIRGELEPETPKNYILTSSVRRNLKDLVRVVSIGKMPVLLQGDTSVGKTSLITYLAKASGHVCVRINNHEHTDLQEYVGNYVADEMGKLVFKEGVLVEAMRKGYWIILDELNLAPSDVLEALNRVLDDNRELFIPETQQTVKAHSNFMLFATQNPPGVYGGRKVLSRAFRNRFVELHFDEIPADELQIILHERCHMPNSYCKQIINVMTDLQIRRKSTATFSGKQGFITLRDLFRWGERYRLAPDVGTNSYDWRQHLADEGYLVLAAKVRRPEEAEEIQQVIKKHLKCNVDPKNLFSLHEKTSSVTKPILETILNTPIPQFEHIVWTYPMRRMAVLVTKSCQFKEPVLLVGETGGGKTTVCQLVAAMRNCKLFSVNCHMHTESSDFLGSLRPVRDHSESNNKKLFEWVDGPLIMAMRNGDVFLADEISLADDSVLERMNSLLEPERSLLLAEKNTDSIHSNECNSVITANEEFCFIGTMNPGGDYGKKELSPALRNRFTEIWCEGCVSNDDLKTIIQHNLFSNDKNENNDIANAILQFLDYLKISELGKKFTISIRDVLTWVNFINSVTKNISSKLTIWQAFIEGAYLTYLDSLGSGVTGTESKEKIEVFKNNLFNSIQSYEQKLKKYDEELTVDKININQENLHDPNEKNFGIEPFYIPIGPNGKTASINFTFIAPTTKLNTQKILRALQLHKPLLLEGSPGVGKTSLVSAIAKASGYNLLRINLSDQTDVSDLFGADLPVEGGKGGEFAWKDGPFLRALRAGDWILLDELNLASQSVLEGLNACLDHRGEIYIPELGRTFTVKNETKLFACQNPLSQGGARRGLPKSFLNRFTQVYVEALSDEDLKIIAQNQFPHFKIQLIDTIIDFNSQVSTQVGKTWAHSGAPWEMNLRDISRWCELINSLSEKNRSAGVNAAKLLYIDRMRTVKDRDKMKELYFTLFGETSLISQQPLIHIDDKNLYFDDVVLPRTKNSFRTDHNLFVLRHQIPILKSLAQCVEMNWMPILVGASGTGKSSVVRVLAQLAGQKLRSIVVNSAMDTTEILGGFEQTDYNRHLEEIIDETENHLIEISRVKLNKENLQRIIVLHRQLEKIQHLSNNENFTTMAMETEIFLRRTEELYNLISDMKTIECSFSVRLTVIEKKLVNLSNLVKQDNCLNAGGKFEWVDSVLVKCLKDGSWLLMDQVNLCSPAVLDRLNGLLEPGGVLTIGERGVDNDGNIHTIKPHKNFRLFLTMDPRYGEISRAMRNRGVEIFLLENNDFDNTNILDIRSMMFDLGLTGDNHQDTLWSIHNEILSEGRCEDKLSTIQLLHSAFLVTQQISRGFSVKDAFKNACIDVYIKSKYIYQSEIKERIISIINKNIQKYNVNQYIEPIIDLSAATLNIHNLQNNTKITIIKQQAILLTTVLDRFRQQNHDENSQLITTKFLNEYFNLKLFNDNCDNLVINIETLYPYLLFLFYIKSSLDDVILRKKWLEEYIRYNGIVISERQKLIIEKMTEEILKSANNVTLSSLPWYSNIFSANTENIPFKYSPSISMALHLICFDIINVEIPQLSKLRKNLSIMEYSYGLDKNLITERDISYSPFVKNFYPFISQSKKWLLTYVNNSIQAKELEGTSLITFRLAVQWFKRFYEIGKNLYINSLNTNENDHFSNVESMLLLHYKWLRKNLLILDWISVKDELKVMMTEFDRRLYDGYLYRKYAKSIKNQLCYPPPIPTETAATTYQKLYNNSDIFCLSLPSQKNFERKLIQLQVKKALELRCDVIRTWENIFNMESDLINDTILLRIEEFSNRDIIHETFDMMSQREFETLAFNTNLWPLYQYVFYLFANDLYRQLNDHVKDKSKIITINENLIMKFNLMPCIPPNLMAIINTIVKKIQTNSCIKNLLPEFYIHFAAYKGGKWQSKCLDFDRIKDEFPSDDYDNSTCDHIDIFNYSNNTPLLTMILSDMTIASDNEHKNNKSIITVAPLSLYKTHIKQMNITNYILWKNSISFNSKQYDPILNDEKVLLSFTESYTNASIRAKENIHNNQVILNKYPTWITTSNNDGRLRNEQDLTDEEKINKEFEDNFNEIQNTLKCLYNYENEQLNYIRRGLGWIYMGHHQIFLFSHIDITDPIIKNEWKIKYYSEDIKDLKTFIYADQLDSYVHGGKGWMSRINENGNVYLEEAIQHLDKILNKQETTVISSKYKFLNNSYNQFAKKVADIRHYQRSSMILTDCNSIQNLINDHTIQDLNWLEEKVNELIDSLKNSLKSWYRIIATWKRENFANYREHALPLLNAMFYMVHGAEIIINSINQINIGDRCNYNLSLSAEYFLYNLVKFPTIGPNQRDLLQLVHLYTSQSGRKFIEDNLADDYTKNNSNIEITMMMIKNGLSELYNYINLTKQLTSTTWDQLNKLLVEIILIWQKQQIEREKATVESESLYKNKTDTRGEELTEEEMIDEQLKIIFPSYYDSDFGEIDVAPSLESSSVKEKSSNANIKSYSNLISEDDIHEVYKLHSQIVRSSVSASWIKPIDSPERNYIDPLLQRFKTFSLLLPKLKKSLSIKLSSKLHMSFTLLTTVSTFTNQGKDFIAEIRGVKSSEKPYDFYNSSNVEKVEQCLPILENIMDKIEKFLTEWPDHPTLKSIQQILQRINHFSITSPISRFLTGYELLLTKMREWEENAHSGVSLSECTKALTQQIIDWRRLELNCWKDCLNTAFERLKAKTSKWWFFLYSIIDSYMKKSTINIDHTSELFNPDTAHETNEIVTAKKLIELLDIFMRRSSLVEFQSRLDLLLTFHCHVFYLETSLERNELLAIFWNMYNYYSRFTGDVEKKINSIKTPIEKKLRDFVKIARWNDINYWSVKETVEKTHRTLLKFIKEYETELKQNVDGCLIIKSINYSTEMNRGEWDRSKDRDYTINPRDFTVFSDELKEINVPFLEKDDFISRSNKNLVIASNLCKKTILMSSYPGLRVELEHLIDDFINHSIKLKNMDIDRTLPKPKQKAHAKSILQQKKRALADYFKTLTNIGVSYRRGNQAWQSKQSDVLNMLVPPLDISTSLQKLENISKVDKQLLAQWDGCDTYYYKSYIKMQALHSTMAKIQTDLGLQNVERCRGYSTHIMLMAVEQKKLLAESFNSYIRLRKQIRNLSNIDNRNISLPQHTDIILCVDSLKKLLISLLTGLEQLELYLHTCPEYNDDIEEKSIVLKSSSSLSSMIHAVKGNDIWQSANTLIKDSINSVNLIFQDNEKIFGDMSTPLIRTFIHFNSLKNSCENLMIVTTKITNFGKMFDSNEEKSHPILNTIEFLVNETNQWIYQFNSIKLFDSGPTPEYNSNLNDLKLNTKNIIETILLVIQKKYKEAEMENNEMNDDEEGKQLNCKDEIANEEISKLEENGFRGKLIEALNKDIVSLRLGEIDGMLENILKIIQALDPLSGSFYNSLLLKCLPIFKQYLLFVQFYLNEQVAAFRVTCKFLHLQLNVFLDLATNGFCMPKDLDLEDGEGDPEGSEQSTDQGGMGLGDGEGKKDVSDRIESEDQLDDARPADEEKKDDDKDCKEEDGGIDMSENFDGKMQDIDENSDNENDEKSEDEDNKDLDKEMGETENGADQLDEEIWGDDQPEDDTDQQNDDTNEQGKGEEIGEKELSAKDESKNGNNESDDKENHEENDEQEKKEINEINEPDVNDDQIDPYHGKHDPQPEPEPMDLPEDLNLDGDDEGKEDNAAGDENPFDIDEMKEAILPEKEEMDPAENLEKEDDKNADENLNEDSSDEEGGDQTTEDTEMKDLDVANEEVNEETEASNQQVTEPNKEEEENKLDDENKNSPEEQKVGPSTDDASKEMDSAEQSDCKADGSRDKVVNQPDQENRQESTAEENSQEDGDDKGTGQAQSEEQSEGHVGSAMQKNTSVQQQPREESKLEKRKRPGESDENRALINDKQLNNKKQKIHNREELAEADEENTEAPEQDENGEVDMCQHVKDSEKFDSYAIDAATEEQLKTQQIANSDDEDVNKNEDETMDIDMQQDTDKNEDDEIQPINSEATQQTKKDEEQSKSKSKGTNNVEDNANMENKIDVEGENVETMGAARAAESAFFTKIIDYEISTGLTQVERKRMEVEKMLSQWTYVPSTTEALAAWNCLSSVTEGPARDLSEKLRLVLEPTQATRLKGDYRTGKRINMRKIIPYIASQFRKDKIWMRRTKPSKRDYQIILALDDSSSMADNHSKELAFESLSLISKAMGYLEVGQLSVISFGESPKVLHPLGEPFTEHSGSRLIQEMRFDQKKTMMGQLVDFTVDMFENQKNSMDNAKLLVVLSDGRGIFSEGVDYVNRAVRRAKLADIFLVFIIVENPENKDSILDIRMPIFENGKLLEIRPYMDSFPFPFYMILRDINALPGVLSDALRQWFEVVGKIDS